jgi:hypothetical protein
MRRILRFFAVLMIAGAVMLAGTGVALAAVVVHKGVVMVSVEDRGPDGVSLYLPVPAAFFEFGASAVRVFMPDHQREALTRKLEPWRDSLHAAFTAIEDCPDAVLVHVETDHERVHIAKEGRSLEISVHDRDSDVRVSLPVASFNRLLRSLS